MSIDPDVCYHAMRTRDDRFDGVFFVGVSSTGIYCRPICRVRLPQRKNCRFFGSAFAAEQKGFRACFRCRPELAPGHAREEATPQLARRALSWIQSGFLNTHSVEDLAAKLSVSARHLRRALKESYGTTPVALAQSKRLALAKQLLQDTSLSLGEVAFASGFGSIRRFNASFQQQFRCPPTQLRHRQAPTQADETDSFSLRLDYRPPYDWQSMLDFWSTRAIPGVVTVTDTAYSRTVRTASSPGWIRVTQDLARHALHVTLSLSLLPHLMQTVTALRALFDLDAQPQTIEEHLAQDALFAPLVEAKPGLRLPGAFDLFEGCVRVLLGQRISVKAATTLCGRVAQHFGQAHHTPHTGLSQLFPSAATLASSTPTQIAALGIPKTRAHALYALSCAVAEGKVLQSRTSAIPETIARLCAIPGIGDWTAQAITMHVLSWPDALPASDLGLRKVFPGCSTTEIKAHATQWQPWRSYAVLRLWTQGLAPHITPT